MRFSKQDLTNATWPAFPALLWDATFDKTRCQTKDAMAAGMMGVTRPLTYSPVEAVTWPSLSPAIQEAIPRD